MEIRGSSGEEVAAVENCMYKNGASRYLCLLKDYTVNDTGNRKATIKLPSKSFIYDMRDKKYYGYTDMITTDILPAKAKVFALLPYSVQGIGLNLAHVSLHRGDNLDFKLKLITSTPACSPHILRIDLIDPEGRTVGYYSKNLYVEKGFYSDKINLSLTEKIGEWELVATDVISGKQVRGKLKVN